MTCQTVNRFDNRLVNSFDDITEVQVEARIAAATACLATWKRTCCARRALIVNRAARHLRDRTGRFAEIITTEMGKRPCEAKAEIGFRVEILACHAPDAARFPAGLPLHPSQGTDHVESSPIGVIFCVEPWNFPPSSPGPDRRAATDGGHCGRGQTCRLRAAMGHGV